MAANLYVHGGSPDTGGAELGHQPVGIGDHEVSVQWRGGNPGQGCDHGWTEGEIRNEVSIHQIEVQQIGAGGFDLGDLSGEPGKIRRQKGWSDANIHRLTHTEMMSDRDSGEPAGGYWRSTIPAERPG